MDEKFYRFDEMEKSILKRKKGQERKNNFFVTIRYKK